MKKNYVVLILLFSFFTFHSYGQAGQWVWIHGDSVLNNGGSYGLKGVGNSSNNPPAFYEAGEWTDLNGNFWLFGGLYNGNSYADLWKFDTGTNEWTWMNGPG